MTGFRNANTFTTQEKTSNQIQNGQTVLDFTSRIEGPVEHPIGRAQIRVQRSAQTDGSPSPRLLILDQSNGEWVKVQGAALAALRDAINTLPAEAFEEPDLAWVEGDTIVFVGTEFTSTWTRQADGVWTGVRSYAKAADCPWAGSARRVPPAHDDRLIDSWLETNYVTVIRRGGVEV